MRKNLKMFVSVLMAFAILFSLAVPAMAAEAEIRVPVSAYTSDTAAGVELRIQNEDGLKLSSWERTGAAKKLSGPVTSQKNGVLQAGLINAQNVLEPDDNGMVDLGTLVFTGSGKTPVVLSAEFAHVVDKSTITTSVYNMPTTKTLSLATAETQLSGTTVALRGSDKVDTAAKELTYYVTVSNVEELATVTVELELDAATMGEPVVEALNGFNVLSTNFNEVDGKWVGEVVIFNVAGLTTETAKDILSVTAPSKGTVGTATATLTGAALSCYLGDDDEAFVTTTISSATVNTTIEKEQTSTPDTTPDHGNIDSRPSINGSAAADKNEFPFKDVNRSDWFYDEVRDAWENGLIDGVTATEFQPSKNLTVAEAIKLAAVLYQKDNEGKVTLTNGTANWYDTYVDYAVKNGVIDAKYQKYTRAQMDAAVTRAEFVAIFYGAMDNYTAKNTVADNAIPDVKTGDYAAKEIYTFYRAGICIGNDKLGTFLPKNAIKRCEVATILTRMYDTTAREFIYLP